MGNAKILDYMKENILFLDGGMGTLLQEQGLKPGELPERWNISHPDKIQSIHKSYYDAGSNVVSTNTFGANSLKFNDNELEEIIRTAINNVQKAKETSTGTQEKFNINDADKKGDM